MEYEVNQKVTSKEPEQEFTVKPIEQLQNEGVGMADIIRLKSSGLCTVQALFMMTKRNLCKIKGMSDLKAEKLKEIAAKLVDIDFQTANEFCEKRLKLVSTILKKHGISFGPSFMNCILHSCLDEN